MSWCKWYLDSLRRRQMTVMASRITGQSSVCLTVCSDWQQRNINGTRYCSFVRGIHRLPVDSLHKGTVTRQMLPFGDVIIYLCLIMSGKKNVWSRLFTSDALTLCYFADYHRLLVHRFSDRIVLYSKILSVFLDKGREQNITLLQRS